MLWHFERQIKERRISCLLRPAQWHRELKSRPVTPITQSVQVALVIRIVPNKTSGERNCVGFIPWMLRKTLTGMRYGACGSLAIFCKFVVVKRSYLAGELLKEKRKAKHGN